MLVGTKITGCGFWHLGSVGLMHQAGLGPGWIPASCGNCSAGLPCTSCPWRDSCHAPKGSEGVGCRQSKQLTPRLLFCACTMSLQKNGVMEQ